LRIPLKERLGAERRPKDRVKTGWLYGRKKPATGWFSLHTNPQRRRPLPRYKTISTEKEEDYQRPSLKIFKDPKKKKNTKQKHHWVVPTGLTMFLRSRELGNCLELLLLQHCNSLNPRTAHTIAISASSSSSSSWYSATCVLSSADTKSMAKKNTERKTRYPQKRDSVPSSSTTVHKEQQHSKWCSRDCLQLILLHPLTLRSTAPEESAHKGRREFGWNNLHIAESRRSPKAKFWYMEG